MIHAAVVLPSGRRLLRALWRLAYRADVRLRLRRWRRLHRRLEDVEAEAVYALWLRERRPPLWKRLAGLRPGGTL
ncbi:MAG: hypothetical protein JXA90_10520 [Planctomycetes bacterium]|nr:hypothetical protein [Planctomycetota bacterium]